MSAHSPLSASRLTSPLFFGEMGVHVQEFFVFLGRCAMPVESASNELLVERLRRGDPQALASLFSLHRERLKRIVQLRMDRRLQGRTDPSDIIQEVYIDAHQRVRHYLEKPQMPFFLWLRIRRYRVTGQPWLGLPIGSDGTSMRPIDESRRRSIFMKRSRFTANSNASSSPSTDIVSSLPWPFTHTASFCEI